MDRAEAVARYRARLLADPEMAADARRLLAGRELVCWCPEDQPCHADVLLELANERAPCYRAGSSTTTGICRAVLASYSTKPG
jgi:hypothetical protein